MTHTPMLPTEDLPASEWAHSSAGTSDHPTVQEWRDWRWQLRHAARTPQALFDRGLISSAELESLGEVTAQFKTLVTPYYLSLIDREDPQCPIRRQAIPRADELTLISGERDDPIGDRVNAPTPLLVHRYPDRALLFPTYECPMFCRYCFRKEALNEAPIRLHHALPESIAYLRDHPEITEVILSGGDPLMLSTARLSSLLESLSSCSLKRLRIHTRMPVTLPQRIDAQLAEAVSTWRLNKAVTVIAHFNHPREVTPDAVNALTLLRRAGVTLLNQSVLLSGVNDRDDLMRELCLRLGDHGVIPYYLHHPDLTRGTHSYRVSLSRGVEMYRKLRGTLSGYLIPRYVIEIPGGYGKVEVASEAVRRGSDQGEWWLTSPLDGSVHHYVDPAEFNPSRSRSSIELSSDIEPL